jgi:hypothetical protein
MNNLSLKVKSWDKRKVGRKTNLILRWGKAEEQRREIWVRIWREWAPVYGREKYRTFLGAEWTAGFGWDTFSKNVGTQRSNHYNIKFTSEVESTSTLPFLDISISRKNGVFETSVYRKPTFTCLFTNFRSFIPFQYKRSLVSSLIHRFFSLCSNYENFHAQLELYRQILNKNCYPTRLFDRCVRTFLENVSQPKPAVHSAPKKVLYFSLPYTGAHSLQIRTQISRLCSSAFPHLNITL